MTAAAQIGREVDAAAVQMIAEHRKWFEEATAIIERRLGDLEQRERAFAVERAEFDERKARLERAMSHA
jgi:hypothetical protein